MNYAVCSAASVSRPARAMLSAWIRAFLPWPHTSVKIFSTPAICCLETMCQSTFPKAKIHISKLGSYGTDARNLRQYVGGELVYLVMVLSFSLVGCALYRHYCLCMQGRPENRVQDLWRRLKVMLV